MFIESEEKVMTEWMCNFTMDKVEGQNREGHTVKVSELSPWQRFVDM